MQRLRGRPFAAALLLALTVGITSLATPAGATPARISDLLVEREGGRLLASFQLIDGFDESLWERIDSGLPTSILYEIKLERIRRYWFDRRLAKSELQVIAMYNALTRQYLVNYKQDGRLISSRMVKTRAELEQAMTILHALAFVALDEPQSGRWVVRVRAELGSKTVMLLIPTAIQTPWAESATFTGLGPPAATGDEVRPAANPDTR